MNQLFQGISGTLLSGYVGSWLDRHDRHFGVQLVLALNNLNVAASASLLAICLSMDLDSRGVYIACLCLSILFCALSNGAAQGEKIAFTKDWVVVLVSRGQVKTTLSGQNAMLTMIDQISAIVAPLAAGFILTWTGLRVGCIIFVVWNVLAWLGEALLLHAVYLKAPELATRIRSGHKEGEVKAPKQRNAIKVYLRQAVFPAALALALLYMTVLAFDGISMSFGNEQGLPANVLGIFQSIGALLGMTAAITYTVIERRLGVLRVGFVGLLAELSCLSLCVSSVWLPGSPFDPSSYFDSITFKKWLDDFLGSFDIHLAQASLNAKSSDSANGIDWSSWTVNGHSVASLFVLFGGVSLGKFGLWMSDLAITQLIQEQVPEVTRGAVFGVESAICLLFSVGKDETAAVSIGQFSWLLRMDMLRFVTFEISSSSSYDCHALRKVPYMPTHRELKCSRVDWVKETKCRDPLAACQLAVAIIKSNANTLKVLEGLPITTFNEALPALELETFVFTPKSAISVSLTPLNKCSISVFEYDVSRCLPRRTRISLEPLANLDATEIFWKFSDLEGFTERMERPTKVYYQGHCYRLAFFKNDNIFYDCHRASCNGRLMVNFETGLRTVTIAHSHGINLVNYNRCPGWLEYKSI